MVEGPTDTVLLAVVVGAGVSTGSTHTLTQYAISVRRLLHESVNVGFQALNDAWLILYLLSRPEHVSPSLTTCHLLQSSDDPKFVAAGGFTHPSGMMVEMVG